MDSRPRARRPRLLICPSAYGTLDVVSLLQYRQITYGTNPARTLCLFRGLFFLSRAAPLGPAAPMQTAPGAAEAAPIIKRKDRP